MADAGLDPAQSRLALPGCTSARMAFCDGTKHNCTVTVDEHGGVVDKRNSPTSSADDALKKILAPELVS